MAVERRHTLIHRIESWGFHAYWNRFRAMDLDAASNAGARFARRFGPLSSAHATARNNVRLAFPNLARAEEREILDGMWDNLGRLLGEFPHLGSMGLFEEGGRATFEGLDILDRYREPGRPAVFVSGHFANWEVMPAAIVRRGIDCRVTYRQANNPWIDDTIVAARAAYGVKLFAPKGKEGGMSLMRILARGGSVALMNDQKFNTGVSAPFFGHVCMTADGPARLALRFKAPLQPMSVKRLEGARFHVVTHEPIPMDFDGPPETVIVDTVHAVNRFIEARVREAPDQYFWVHKRWPKGTWKAAGIV
jgi:KDO2-lipid IV(A) lauroyltransferase